MKERYTRSVKFEDSFDVEQPKPDKYKWLPLITAAFPTQEPGKGLGFWTLSIQLICLL